MQQKRAYRYRFYPTPEQASMLARTFGSARFVYKWALRLRTDAYHERQERLGYHEASAALTTLKQRPETAWLHEVSSVPLQQALRHLDHAFRNFFAGCATYPTFHKKHGRQAASYASNAFRWDAEAHTLTLARLDTPLDIRWSRSFTGTPTSVTVSKDTAGRYFVAFLVEDEIAPLPAVDTMVGMDVGLQHLAVLSTGERIANPRHLQRSERRLAHAQRGLARKQKGSKNREKARRTVARIHARIADQRRDGLHKLTTRLIRENQTVCVESLAVKHLVRNRTLAKAISDVGWGSWCGNWRTRRRGMGVPWSRSTAGIPVPSAAMRAGMCVTPCHSRSDTGRARRVASAMTGMSTPPSTSLPWDARCTPVEMR